MDYNRNHLIIFLIPMFSFTYLLLIPHGDQPDLFHFKKILDFLPDNYYSLCDEFGYERGSILPIPFSECFISFDSFFISFLFITIKIIITFFIIFYFGTWFSKDNWSKDMAYVSILMPIFFMEMVIWDLTFLYYSLAIVFYFVRGQLKSFTLPFIVIFFDLDRGLFFLFFAIYFYTLSFFWKFEVIKNNYILIFTIIFTIVLLSGNFLFEYFDFFNKVRLINLHNTHSVGGDYIYRLFFSIFSFISVTANGFFSIPSLFFFIVMIIIFSLKTFIYRRSLYHYELLGAILYSSSFLFVAPAYVYGHYYLFIIPFILAFSRLLIGFNSLFIGLVFINLLNFIGYIALWIFSY